MKEQSTSVSAEQSVGDAVRHLRENQRMSVRALATLAGFSPSFISQVENSQAFPSIGSLERISSALGLTLGEFFNALEPRQAAVIRASERRQLTSAWSNASIESLGSAGPGVRMKPILVTLSSGGSSSPDQCAQNLEEFAYVVEGEVSLTVAGQELLLGAGDSVTIPAGRPRRLHNKTSGPATVMIVSARSN